MDLCNESGELGEPIRDSRATGRTARTSVRVVIVIVVIAVVDCLWLGFFFFRVFIGERQLWLVRGCCCGIVSRFVLVVRADVEFIGLPSGALASFLCGFFFASVGSSATNPTA